jgi:hypothetical protein
LVARRGAERNGDAAPARAVHSVLDGSFGREFAGIATAVVFRAGGSVDGRSAAPPASAAAAPGAPPGD